jgi:porphobilinogen deaminase
MDGLVASVDGKKILRENGSCKNTLDQASQLGMALAGAIMRRGAKKIMQMDKGAS